MNISRLAVLLRSSAILELDKAIDGIDMDQGNPQGKQSLLRIIIENLGRPTFDPCRWIVLGWCRASLERPQRRAQKVANSLAWMIGR
jgi:hypothetical protein